MQTIVQDIRYALRQLRKSPAFTLTVIVTLAFGIGANAAVFTLFDQVLLRMLPVEKPKELVRFEWRERSQAPQAALAAMTTTTSRIPCTRICATRTRSSKECWPRTGPVSASVGATRRRTKTPKL
jgi:hypothetical protein